MNVAICVGDTEMPGQKLRQASFSFFFFGGESQAIHVDNMPLLH